ncbi:MAG: LmeA family phospholipid-binding protein [Actinomycetota bacterium]
MVEVPAAGPRDPDDEREPGRADDDAGDLLEDLDGADDQTGAEPGPVAEGGFGLIEDREVVEAARAATDEHRHDPPLFASILALVDDTASRILDHPIRPRVKVSPGGLLRGELDVLKIEVPAVLAAGLVIDRMVLRAEHVRVAPGLPPRLKAGPVTLRAYVSQANVDRWVRTSHLPIKLRLTEEGALLTTGVRGFRMTETLADLEVVGSFLRLAPRRMTIVGLPAPLVKIFRGYLPLPPLPRGARLTEVAHGDGEVAVTFGFEHVDEPLTPDLAKRLGLASRLPIPGLR